MPPGVTGYLKIDSNGDRETDFSLWDMDPGTATFRVRLCPRRQCSPHSLGLCLFCAHPAVLGHLSYGDPWIKETHSCLGDQPDDRV